MENQPQTVFRSRSEVDSDCRLVERYLRQPWLTPERRDAIARCAYALAEECADQKFVEDFHRLGMMLEKMYEFDVKLAEREEDRQLKRGFVAARQKSTAVTTSPPGIAGEATDGQSFEQQRLALSRLINGDAE